MPIAKRRGRPSNAAKEAALNPPPEAVQPAVEQPIEPPAPPAPAVPEVPDVPAAPETMALDPVEPMSVMLGSVEGVLQLVPVDQLLGVLAENFGARLETLQATASVLAQVDRIRDTEGRCAPIIFTGDGETPAALFSNIETLAGAVLSGIQNVAVILVPAGDAGLVQSWLVGCRQKDQKTPYGTVVSPVYSVKV